MDEQGLWRLFLVTGSPRVWLAIRALQWEQARTEAALPAFRAGQTKQI